MAGQRTTTENIEDRQAEISDLESVAEQIVGALDCAESCESPKDFDANLDEVIVLAQDLIAAIRILRS